MEARYERNIPALCEEDCARLRARRVAVIGCGGLGGHLIELLVRVGVGHLRVVDGDVFEPSNLNRQLYSAPALLGCSKAKTAGERVRRMNPETRSTASKAAGSWQKPVRQKRSHIFMGRSAAGSRRLQFPCPQTT